MSSPTQAFAATAPLRLLIMYAGVSQGNDGCTSGGGEPNFLKPSLVGAAYQLPKKHGKMSHDEPSPLQPFITHGVKDNVAVISGLNIPRGPAITSPPPLAGMSGGPPGMLRRCRRCSPGYGARAARAMARKVTRTTILKVTRRTC